MTDSSSNDVCATCSHIRAAHREDHTDEYTECDATIFVESHHHASSYSYPCPCKEFKPA